MSSNEDSDRLRADGLPDDGLLDLARDLPVTPTDVAALRGQRAEVPSWLTLTAAEFEALVPADALDRKPIARDAWAPFSLEP